MKRVIEGKSICRCGNALSAPTPLPCYISLREALRRPPENAQVAMSSLVNINSKVEREEANYAVQMLLPCSSRKASPSGSLMTFKVAFVSNLKSITFQWRRQIIFAIETSLSAPSGYWVFVASVL
jgi:hypothetical protein